MAIENQELEEGKSVAKKMMNEARSAADRASEEAKRYSSRKMEEGRDRTADGLDRLAHAADTAASDLESQHQETISRYVREMADRVGMVAEGLRDKSVDELIDDAKATARKNPALFVAGSVAIGLCLSRFVKASARRSREDEEYPESAGEFTTREDDLGSRDRAPW